MKMKTSNVKMCKSFTEDRMLDKVKHELRCNISLSQWCDARIIFCDRFLPAEAFGFYLSVEAE